VAALNRFISHIENDSPLACIFGDQHFVGYFLAEHLKQRGCSILDHSKLDGKIDYIFYIWSGKSKEALQVLNLAVQKKAKLLMALPADQPEIRQLLLQQTCLPKIDYRLVLYGKIYGPRMPKAEYSSIENISLVAPALLFVSDLVYGLTKAMFAVGTTSKTFALLPTEQQRFLASEKNLDDLGWRPQVNLAEGIAITKRYFAGPDVQRQSFSAAPTATAPKNIRPKPAEQGSHPPRPSRFRHLPYFLVLLLTLFSPFIITAFIIIFGLVFLRSSQSLFLQGKFSTAAKHAHISQKSLSFIRPLYDPIPAFLHLAGLSSAANQTEKLFRIAQTGSSTLITASSCAGMAETAFASVLDQSADPQAAGNLFPELAFCLDKTHIRLSYLEMDSLHTSLGKRFSFLPEARRQLYFAKSIAPHFSDLLGINSPKSYLVLFQNNAELRPTGGFIGSYGILYFNQGKLADFEVKDVYWADGQLKGHVEPPAELKKYLGEATWYLRDSNWDPDFPISAARAAWFLEKETGRAVDGVIAVNLYLVQNLLSHLGEIYLSDFNETITSANLFEKAEYHSETNFFPGSTQKQDFLGSLAAALLEEIKIAPPDKQISLLKSVWEVAEQKDLSLYLKNQTLEEMILTLGWGGEVRSLSCSLPQNCLADNLMIVESNVGINKANYFLRRSLNHRLNLTPAGVLEETATLDYHNTSQSQIFPAGRYKSYLRFYLPASAIIDSLRLEDEQGKLLKTYQDNEMVRQVEHNRQSLGCLIEIPVSAKRRLVLNYHQKTYFTPGTATFLYLLQKQPGIIDDQFSVNFSAPDNIVIIRAQPGGSQENNYAVSDKFDKDIFFELNFTQK